MLTAEHPTELDQLLGVSIAAIDIPADVYDRAVARYHHVAAWLAQWYFGPSGGEIFSQGSFRLGTVVAPVAVGGEYDMDLVCRRDILKQSTTQKALKEEVGDALAAYVATNPVGNPRLKSGRRCWTLVYPGEPFHMDILPALPDPDAEPNGILITDRGLTRWPCSNPKDYAIWFRGRAYNEIRTLREAVAKARDMDVEDVPEAAVKSGLQRTVQALKRHRDLFFSAAPDDAPASIIITTLAAHAYRGAGPLHETLIDVVTRLGDFIEVRNGAYYMANPVQDDENFADRWATEPACEARFFEWLQNAQADFAAIGADRGQDRILEAVAKSLGPAAAAEAGRWRGERMRDARETGQLRMGVGGALGVASVGVPVRQHTFHGDAPATPSA